MPPAPSGARGTGASEVKSKANRSCPEVTQKFANARWVGLLSDFGNARWVAACSESDLENQSAFSVHLAGVEDERTPGSVIARCAIYSTQNLSININLAFNGLILKTKSAWKAKESVSVAFWCFIDKTGVEGTSFSFFLTCKKFCELRPRRNIALIYIYPIYLSPLYPNIGSSEGFAPWIILEGKLSSFFPSLLSRFWRRKKVLERREERPKGQFIRQKNVRGYLLWIFDYFAVFPRRLRVWRAFWRAKITWNKRRFGGNLK